MFKIASIRPSSGPASNVTVLQNTDGTVLLVLPETEQCQLMESFIEDMKILDPAGMEGIKVLPTQGDPIHFIFPSAEVFQAVIEYAQKKVLHAVSVCRRLQKQALINVKEGRLTFKQANSLYKESSVEFMKRCFFWVALQPELSGDYVKPHIAARINLIHAIWKRRKKRAATSLEPRMYRRKIHPAFAR